MPRTRKKATEETAKSVKKTTTKTPRRKVVVEEESPNTSTESNESVKRKQSEISDSDNEVTIIETSKSISKHKPKKKAPEPKSKRKGNLKAATVTIAKSPGPSQSTNSSQTRTIEVMRDIFNMSQHTQNMNRCLDRLNRLVKETPLQDAYPELMRNIQFALTGPEKSPYTKNCMEFISKFFIDMWKKDIDKENRDCSEGEPVDISQVDELGLECLGRDSYQPSRPPRLESLADAVLRDVLIPQLENSSVATRVNACTLIRKMFSEIEDIETDTYDKLKSSLVFRMADKNTGVRASAAKTLHRFQETESSQDVVVFAYQYHLKNDPDMEVRKSILLAIEPTEHTIEDIILRTRDIKDSVRKVAYHKLAWRVDLSGLSIEQRVSLLQEGLSDVSPTVRRVVEKEMIANWFSKCEFDFEKLLSLLDISVLNQFELAAVEKLLFTIFTDLVDKLHSSGKTKFSIYVDKFRNEYLDDRRLLKRKPLNVENGYLWRAIVKYCKDNESKLQVLPTPVNENDDEEKEIETMLDNIHIPEISTLSQESQDGDQTIIEEAIDAEGDKTIVEDLTPPKKRKVEKAQEVDTIDLVLPEIPHMCSYLKTFLTKMVDRDCNDLEKIECQFLFDQLVELISFITIRDEAQKRMLVKNVYELIFLPNIDRNLKTPVVPFMRIIADALSPEELLNFTKDLTQEVYNKVVEGEHEEMPQEPQAPRVVEPLDVDKLHELDLKYAKISVDIEELRDEIESHIEKQDFLKAEELKRKRILLEKEKEIVSNERFLINNSNIDDIPQSSQQTEPAQSKTQLFDHPESLFKCLQIFTGCLEFGHFTQIDTFIRSHIDNIILPSVLSSDVNIRQLAIKGLGLCCFISSSLFVQYLTLFIQALRHDFEAVGVTVLQALFDCLCEHGVDIVIQEASKKDKPDADIEREVEAETGLGRDDEDQNGTRGSDEDAEDLTLDQFIDQLTLLIKEQLGSQMDEIRHVAVEGVAKMLTLGRIYSPPLLSRLLLIWYNTETAPKTKQFLGVYFPFFAYSDNARTTSAGQSTFEECYLDTIKLAHKNSELDEDSEELIESPLSQIEIENLVGFVTQMLNEESAVRVAISTLNELINLYEEDEIHSNLIRYYFKALSVLPLSSASKNQVDEISVLLEKLSEYPMPTLSSRRVSKLKEKVTLMKSGQSSNAIEENEEDDDQD
ncbi:Condensin complex subunit 3 [Halotydeus destructor]|nr:Condensin complex subunit 3 [Halotydeus destructor]